MYPILLELGPITIFSQWFFIGIGLISATLMFSHLAKRNRIKVTAISEHSFALFIWVLVISRISFIILNFNLYFPELKFSAIFGIFSIWDKGLSFWCGAIAWVAGVYYLSKRKKEDPAILFDIMTPALLLGLFFADIGLFLDGESHGSPTSMPWGVAFRNANVRYVSPVHPTQIYSAIYSLIILFTLLKAHKKLRGSEPGLLAELGVFLLSSARFTEEFFRGDDVLSLGFIRLTQVVALGVAIYSGHRLYKRYLEKYSGEPDNPIKRLLTTVAAKQKKKSKG